MEKVKDTSRYPHKIGEYVSYKANGICRISDIVRQDFADLGEKVYYEMRLFFDEKTIIYVPVDSAVLEAGMRHILSKDEIDTIIVDTEKASLEWNDNQKERIAQYSEILSDGDKSAILLVIRNLNARKAALEADGRKMYASDLKTLEAAEKIITEEFSFGLGIDRGEVVPYILSKISE